VIRTRSRRLEPAGQRVRRALRRLRGGAEKRQAAHLVEIGELRVKRLRFADVAQAQAAQRVLEAVRESGVAPAPIARYAHELWLEFVPGRALDPAAPAPVDALGQVFRTLYAAPRRVDAEAPARLVAEIARDAALLREADLLDRATHDRLVARASATMPPQLERGIDYLDARPANFVATDAGLRIVDVESLVEDEPIGTGAARAWLRWPGVARDALLAAIGAQGGVDLRPVADFVALRFATRWTLRCLLQRKHRQLDAAWLERLGRLAHPD
jgi:hypothetical protein